MNATDLLDSAAACRYLETRHGINLKPRTLAAKRRLGTGPLYHRLSNTPVYRSTALDAWAAEYLGPAFRCISDEPHAA